MIKYTYKCRDCSEELTTEFERGEAPREHVCPVCSGIMKRKIGTTVSEDISSKDDTVNRKSEQIRKNLKKRTERKKEMTKEAVERLDKWSKKETGGRW